MQGSRVQAPVEEQAVLRVYQRDNSFYRSHGWGGKWHFLGVDLRSKCGRARMLNTDAGLDATEVPATSRCNRKGCRERWPGPSI